MTQKIQVATPIPAASVATVRDGAGGLELLYLKRSHLLSFAPSTWVFPGGRIDPGDRIAGNSELEIAQRAAVREAAEEASLDLRPEELLNIYHWTTPEDAPKRFATWFFVTTCEGHEQVRVDGEEIVEHRWAKPEDALELRASGDMSMAVPIFVLSTRLAQCESVKDASAQMKLWQAEVMEPRSFRSGTGRVALYEGDAGYSSRDPSVDGRRHRMWMLDEGWRYERD